LFPIAWREPFGLVMIETMACGTPVVAIENGSVPEVLEHGVTGFIVHNEDEAVRAARQLAMLDRGRIRAEFDRRFTAQRMAQNYVSLYSRLIEQRKASVEETAESPEFIAKSLVRSGHAATPAKRESATTTTDNGVAILQ
jgi:glycogen synthase